jgi:trk system potassium uptake protein TrkA
MKFCVIGLGRFGFRVATTLAENGMEVLGIDSNESIVASIRDHITQAVCLKVHDEDSLRSIGVEDMDTVIVAMGENFAESILVTALLKKRLSVAHVITRAVSEIHKDILKLIGADQVILPEQEIGRKLADTLSYPHAHITRITPDFGFSQITTPSKFVGKTVGELRLFDKYSVHCIAVRKNDRIVPIDVDYLINEDEQLVFAGPIEKLIALAKLASK